ncbi:MAG TPA: ABC transporter ATP-binding protein [Gammaproteobacteria bacterium]|nr:ABC transporter ATP-binding protein [Gammaproteobacteria bacterium]
MAHALQIKDLHKTYKGGFEALKGISMEVSEGDFFALLGPNGAGKSTTIGILTSLVRKSSGNVLIFGHDIDREPSQAKQRIGLVPQEFNFNQFEPVEEILINQAGYYGISRKASRPKVDYFLNKLGLWDKRRGMARALSGGMKRRLMIARAMVHEPKMLILDEPTAGVDIEIRRSMWEFLKEINERGTTIILTTHYLEEAENLCRNIAIIDQGTIIENTSMKALLNTLDSEVFILDLRQPLVEAPEIDDMAVKLIDDHTLEVTIQRHTALNDVFIRLQALGIEITSLRNKHNRLEELFLHLINNGAAA